MKTQPFLLSMTTQAPGAWPNGTIVQKVNSQPDDGTPNGTLGTVTGSLDVSKSAAKEGLPARFAYFVDWRTTPGVPVFCVDTNNDGTPRLELAP